MARQPPEKRRKTEPDFDDDFWDGDSDAFSQAVLEIDNIILSQQSSSDKENARSSIAPPSAETSNATPLAQTGFNTKSSGYSSLQRGHTTGSIGIFPKTSQVTATLQTCPPPGTILNQSTNYAASTSNCRSTSDTSRNTSVASSQFTFAMKEKLKAVEEENAFLKDENQKLKGAQYGKDGQIKFLRTKVAQLESDKFKDRQEKVQLIDQQEKDKNEREKRMEKEMEKLKTMMQFKEHEIEELQERCRRQDKQVRVSDGSSPVRPGFSSPIKSSQRPVPSSPRSANDSCFPTASSFMKPEGSPNKRNKLGSDTPRDAQITTLEHRQAQSSLAKARRLRLQVSHSPGDLTGAQLVGQLAENPCREKASSEGQLSWRQGIFSLLEEFAPSVDISSLQFERDELSLNFKPRPISNHTVAPVFSLREVANHSLSQQSLSLAQQAISHLLYQSGANLKRSNQKVALNIACCTNLQAVMLVPLVEEILENYLETMSTLNKNSVQNSSNDASGSSKATVESGSAASVTSSIQELALKGASYINDVEARTLCALKVLHKLLQHSAHVRIVFFYDKHHQPACTNADFADDVPMETNDELQDVLSQLDSTGREVAKNCDILNKILNLANPVETNNSLGNARLAEYAMRILTVAIPTAPASIFQRLISLFSQDCLLNSLTEDIYFDAKGNVKSPVHMFNLVSASMQLLTALVCTSEIFLDHLCSQDDDCLLLLVYRTCVHTIKTLKPRQRQSICLYVFKCLGTIVAKYQKGINLLLNTKCNCCLEIIQCIVISMLREMQLYKDIHGGFTLVGNSCNQSSKESVDRLGQDNNCTLQRESGPHGWPTRELLSQSTLDFLKQGLILLHAITMRDGLFTSHHEDECRHEFAQLMCDIHRLLTAMPESPERNGLLNLIPDLWDLDMDYPEDCSDQVDSELFGRQRSGSLSSRLHNNDAVLE